MKQTLKEIVYFIILLILVIGIWIFFKYWIENNILESGQESALQARGLFGDQFGAINSLFSGMAFAGIIFTILLQRRELSEARKATNYQRFENTFFQLLKLHTETTEQLISLQQKGREAVNAFNEKLKQKDRDFVVFCALQKLSKPQIREIKDNKSLSRSEYPELELSDVANIEEALKAGTSAFDNYLDSDPAMHEVKIRAAYKSTAETHIDEFSHYFRNLYRILKFIDDSPLVTDSEKKEYSKFVRSQLSDTELVAIFYNSLTAVELSGRTQMELGYPKMTALIKKYDILQNMSPRSILHPIHQEIFNTNAEAASCK